MDETFEKVDFSYTDKATSTKKEVQTLEIIEYGAKEKAPETTFEAAPESAIVTKPEVREAEPEASQKIIRDNQTGVSYEKLFGR
ncbi:hypothetical protein [Pontibacter diazotrophicus]|uniref:hypothetical protein n=1 Tax=Pontibacter diazotrophicus TaxID=1400979 RepID=UPI001FE58E1A